MTLRKHLDEARKAAIESLCSLMSKIDSIERAVLIDDLFGMLRVVVWIKEKDDQSVRNAIDEELRQVASPYWSGEVFVASAGTDVDRIFYDRAWEEGRPIMSNEALRVADRYRSRGSWLNDLIEAPWNPGKDVDEGPPILVFYSFKGGVGRSTALASFAIQRARAGERVAIIDFDLDAPGIGVLLAADENGTMANWGVIDYLLERPILDQQKAEIDLQDYYHVCRREKVTGSGEIFVIPAGRADSGYIGKLARIDFEQPFNSEISHPIILLLKQIKEELSPNWILLDSRAGLSDPAGLLLGGLAHMYVVFGTSSEQSWQGLRLVLHRLGAERIWEGKMQLYCLLVQGMVPENSELSKISKSAFADRAKLEFSDQYLAPDPDDPDEDLIWYVRDMDEFMPAAVSYREVFAHFRTIDEVADKLSESEEHRSLIDRIVSRFLESEDEVSGSETGGE